MSGVGARNGRRTKDQAIPIESPPVTAAVTGGASLKANIALVENNARLGAEIAVAYARLIARAPEE